MKISQRIPVAVVINALCLSVISVIILFLTQNEQKSFWVTGLLVLTVIISSLTIAVMGRTICKPIEKLSAFARETDSSESEQKKVRSELLKIDEFASLTENLGNWRLAIKESKEALENCRNELDRANEEKEKSDQAKQCLDRYFKNTIQSLQSIIITTDDKLYLMHQNAQARKYGSGKKKLIYSRFPFLNDFNIQIERALNEKKSYSEQAVQINSEEERLFNLHITPISGFEPGGIIIRLDDITDLKKTENQLIQAQKWETLAMLTSGFAHDFNNVLAGIITSTSLLMHRISEEQTGLDQSFINCMKIIEQSGQRASGMVQQLLSLSESGELIFSEIDLIDSVKEVEAICRNTFDKSVKIESSITAESSLITGDKNQIEQILLNLCINSYQSMTEMRRKGEEQGGVLKLEMNRVFIDEFHSPVSAGIKKGPYVRLTVSDTGVGMGEELKRQVFEPFFTTKEKGRGSGLGLTVVKHIVEQHNGFINVYSEQERGTVISIYLPATDENDNRIVTEQKKRVPVKGSGTILIIDDEEVIRELAESILAGCGYKVISAKDGYSGVDLYKAKSSSIDLVILDMSMPGISGKETFIQLKQINPEVKILISSGFSRDGRIHDLNKMGQRDFIRKPYDFILLSEMVSNLLNN